METLKEIKTVAEKIEALRACLGVAADLLDGLELEAKPKPPQRDEIAKQVRMAVTRLRELAGFRTDQEASLILCIRANVDGKTIERWASGQSVPRPSTLQKVNTALQDAGVSPIVL